MALDTNAEATSDDGEEFRFHAAFDATAEDRARLDAKKLVPVNLDPPMVMTTVLAQVAKLAALREDAAKLAGFDITHFDKLIDYTYAFAQAHASFLATAERTSSLRKVMDRAVKLRATLLGDATALARRGLLNPKQLEKLKGGTGYLKVSQDLGLLVAIIRARWSEIAGKTAITAEELNEAETAWERLCEGYAQRMKPTRPADVIDARIRAFNLVVNAYDQVRRAAIFLRWSAEDAKTYIPSLYSVRRKRRSKKKRPVDDLPVQHSTVPPPPAYAALTPTQLRPFADAHQATNALPSMATRETPALLAPGGVLPARDARGAVAPTTPSAEPSRSRGSLAPAALPPKRRTTRAKGRRKRRRA